MLVRPSQIVVWIEAWQQENARFQAPYLTPHKGIREYLHLGKFAQLYAPQAKILFGLPKSSLGMHKLRRVV